MEVVRRIDKLRKKLDSHRKKNRTVGLVPTMGYFHEGHLSLMRKARSQCDVVVVSLYVNPTQFGPGEDFADYPRDFEQDCLLAEKEDVDLLFAPEDGEMYPGSHDTFVVVEKLTEGLCGALRPGHFRGVTTVCAKLFNVVEPDKAYFGQKDAQQAAVIRKMVEDLNFNLRVVVCPIVREADGLAMSSRNIYLSSDERKQALTLSQSLKLAEGLVNQGERSPSKIRRKIHEILDKEPQVEPEYVTVCNYQTLKESSEISGETLIAIAAKVGKARLIDNVVVKDEGRRTKGER